MLQIQANGWLFRWAYLFVQGPLTRTDVCTLFWRSLVLTPIVVLGLVIFTLAVCCALLFFLGGVFWAIHQIGPIGGSIATVLLAWIILAGRDSLRTRDTTTLNAIRLVVERVKAVKHNYCALVEVTRD